MAFLKTRPNTEENTPLELVAVCGASSQTHAAAWELPFFVVGLEQQQPEQQQLEQQQLEKQ